MVLDLMFPNNDAIYAFMEMSKNLFWDKKEMDDTYGKEMQKLLDESLKNALLDIEEEQDNAGFWNILGSIYLRKKLYQDAIDSFNKAIEIAPMYKAFWNNLSVAYYQIGEKLKALDCFKEGLLLEKEQGSFITDGPEFVLQGKLLDDYLKEKDLHSSETISALDLYQLGQLAQYYTNCYEPKLAIKCLLRLIRFDSNNPGWYFQMSSCLWAIGEKTRAINFLKKGLIINPDDKAILNTLVDIYFTQREFQKALEYLQRLHAIDPDDIEIILDIAAAYSELHNKDEAIYYLRKSLDIDPSSITKIIIDSGFIPYLNSLRESIF